MGAVRKSSNRILLAFPSASLEGSSSLATRKAAWQFGDRPIVPFLCMISVSTRARLVTPCPMFQSAHPQAPTGLQPQTLTLELRGLALLEKWHIAPGR